MEIGIIGLPQSGKSSLFEIMTGVKSRDLHGEICVRGLAAVPDPRFERLVEIFAPAKVSPARIPFSDVNAAGEKAWNAVRQSLSGADGLVHIVDAFTALDLAEALGRYRKLEDELILSDLLIVENRLERLAKTAKKPLPPQDALHAAVLPRLLEQLEGGKPLRGLPLSDEEKHGLRSFSFWTIRPELVVVNTPEDDPSVANAFLQALGTAVPGIGICCEIEAELIALPVGERNEFLQSLGIAEAAFGRVIKAAFSLLGQISYFTVGEDEVKAWVIPAGTKAPKAAGVIHNDFERGFIKAEVIGYEEFIACGGSYAGVRSQGKLRLEGKEYIVQDGEIINFRFNV
ncbi:MAG: YchF family ATPase [Syntrophobacterales bacterium]|nr:YchF family ATPase [Syntrophobacterales bacterium]